MGVRQAMVLIGNARQATNEGKVETGLTRLVAMALCTYVHLVLYTLTYSGYVPHPFYEILYRDMYIGFPHCI